MAGRVRVGSVAAAWGGGRAAGRVFRGELSVGTRDFQSHRGQRVGLGPNPEEPWNCRRGLDSSLSSAGTPG